MLGKTDVIFKISADDSDFRRKLKSSVNTLDSAVQKASRYAAVAGAAASAALVVVGKEALKAASDMEETQSKFNVVFRGMSKEAENWAKTLQKGYAMSELESKRFLSSIQDLVVPTGMAREEAGKLSSQFVQLAADLGSFNNRDTADVVRDIQSALQGSSETMAKYGINVKAAKVEQEVFALGLAKTKDEITDAHKAQAIYSIAIREGADAIGDMARTYESFANQQKQLSANMTDLKVALGDELLPVASELLAQFNAWSKENDNLKNTLSVLVDIVKAVGSAFYEVGEFIGVTAAKIVIFIEDTITALDRMKEKLQGEILGAWNTFKDAVTSPIDTVVNFFASGSSTKPFTEKIEELLGVFGIFVKKAEDPIKTHVDATDFSAAVVKMDEEFTGLVNNTIEGTGLMTEEFGNFYDASTELTNQFTDLMLNGFDDIGSAFDSLVDNMLRSFVNMLAEMAAKWAAAGIVKSVSGVFGGGSPAPQKSAGGIVSGVASGAATGAAIGSVVPVIGTAVGGVVGGILGGIGSIFGFAEGGYHQGGMRLVGEKGPELEVTGPSRIYNAEQTKDILSGRQNVDVYITLSGGLDKIIEVVDSHVVERNVRGLVTERAV